MMLTRVAEADGGVALAAAVSLADAKAHLNVMHATDDDLIAALVEVAQQHLEGADGLGGILGRAVVRHVLEARFDAFPGGSGPIVLPQPPLVTVASIAYRDAAGDAQTLAPESWRAVAAHDGGVVVLMTAAGWPSSIDDAPDAVTVRFTCGYETVPAPLRHAMLLHVGHLYRNREAVGESASALPMAYDALIGPFRTHGWR